MTKKKKLFESFYLKKENYFILIAGVALIIVGYVFSSIEPWDSFESLVVAPIVLTIGYCVVIPIGIFYKKKS